MMWFDDTLHGAVDFIMIEDDVPDPDDLGVDPAAPDRLVLPLFGDLKSAVRTLAQTGRKRHSKLP